MLFRSNFEATGIQFGDFRVLECFVPHFESENPEFESKWFIELIEQQEYTVIETLRLLASRKTFKGTCPGCP